jgi:hypothetical protein
MPFGIHTAIFINRDVYCRMKLKFSSVQSPPKRCGFLSHHSHAFTVFSHQYAVVKFCFNKQLYTSIEKQTNNLIHEPEKKLIAIDGCSACRACLQQWPG